MTVDLGLPELPPAPLAPRRKSRQIMVGKGSHAVPVGGGAPVSVQSMATTVTADVNATLQQIAELTATGCQIVRVAVPSQDDADALPDIARKSQIPVIADIHFQPKYVFAAIDAGCAAVRVNPGNIKAFDDKVAEIARAASDAGIPIRIGVNAGSLDKRLLAKHGKATAGALVESALWECSLFEEHGFTDIKISVKHHDPVVMINAYRELAERCDYPLHLGVTEAGPTFQGTVKSAVAFGALLAEGIGDTIRVSLSAPPVEEVKVGIAILESLGLRQRGLEIVSCPSCGRAQVDVYTLADQVTAGLEGLDVPLRVAVMGCVVNGPGEAREADLGVASGNGKGQIFVKGEVVKTVPESQIVETLIEEAMKLAETLAATGAPEVTVSLSTWGAPNSRAYGPSWPAMMSWPTRSQTSLRASAGKCSSVTSVSTSSRSANELSPTMPHLVWSATTITRRAERTKARLVSDSARLGVVSPAPGSTPWQPRNSRSKCSDRMARSAIGPTSASDGVRTPPVSTIDVGGAVWSLCPLPWNRLATRIEFVTTVSPGTLNSCSASA
jgi:(E)-4-hydroxy-3-methylbut-2-enyl-diphosphate synthase